MTTNEKIDQAIRAAYEARQESAAAARLESEGTLDAAEAIRRRDDATIKSSRMIVLEREAVRLVVERDGEHPKRPSGSLLPGQEIVAHELARIQGGA